MADPPRSEAPRADAPAPLIEGTCDPAFRAVEAAFRENFASRDEVGAALCVRAGGRVVVDLWGGHADAARTRAWRRDTLVGLYSVGKGVTSMLALSLVERGELDLDAPVATLWPEFAARDKGHTTLRMLLGHRGGLPGVREWLPEGAVLDWAAMTDALAASAPWWRPGDDHGYHVNTFGFLVGEPVVRRLGLSFSDALRTRLTGPLDADFWIGLPDAKHARAADVIERNRPSGRVVRREEAEAMAEQHFGAPDRETAAMLARTYFNPSGLSGYGIANTPEWRRAAVPSTNGQGTARAVAALYDAFERGDPARGGPVGAGLRAEATRTVSEGRDRVLARPSRFGLGFQRPTESRRVGVTDAAYGHFGYGGSLGFADPEAELAFGYLMNRPGDRWHTPRTTALLEALDEALGRRAP